MAIVWGPVNGHLRVGIDVSSSPPASDGRVTVTATYWVETQRYGFRDNQTLVLSGNITGSVPYRLDSGRGQTVRKQVASRSVTVTAPYGDTVPVTLAARVTGAFNGAAPSVSREVRVGPRPYQKPRPPKNPVARVESDNRIVLSWQSDLDGPGGPQPWSHVRISRLDLAGARWVLVATPRYNVTSWTDDSATGNNRYRYAFSAVNEAGESAPVEAAPVVTTPAAPTNVEAVKDGLDILVSWRNEARIVTAWEVWEDDTRIVTGTSGTQARISSPDAASTHTYKVRVQAEGKFSPFSAPSNTVQLLAAPHAPDMLAPSTGQDRESAVRLSWRHVPVDTTKQTAYELQWRYRGTPSWTNVGVKHYVESWHELTGLPRDGVIEWQVRTWGDHASPSPWSAVKTTPVTTRPTVMIQSPTPGSVWEASRLTVEWNYFHAAASPQTGWEIALSGPDYAETLRGNGTSNAATFSTVVQDGETYRVRVRVREASGLWSEWVESSFTVEYARPAAPEVTAEWDNEVGGVRVEVINPPGDVEAVYNQVERLEDGIWQVVIDRLEPDSSFTDYEAPAGGTVVYRVAAVSRLPSEAVTRREVEVKQGREACVWLNGGPGFTQFLRFTFNPQVSANVSRERVLNRFEGRALPVETTGTAVTREMDVSAVLLPDRHDSLVTREQVDAFALLPGPFLYRDPDGRRIYCSVPGLSWSRDPGGKGTVSFKLTEVDYGR
ncbi:fibronectin type III domain-containing protein [Dermabacteraceae bacterium TAE3-ERU27]|nr:fibronectin type III domain-containing protein [Dermabacteraceae bacterium TAE3-ERU27]